MSAPAGSISASLAHPLPDHGPARESVPVRVAYPHLHLTSSLPSCIIHLYSHYPREPALQQSQGQAVVSRSSIPSPSPTRLSPWWMGGTSSSRMIEAREEALSRLGFRAAVKQVAAESAAHLRDWCSRHGLDYEAMSEEDIDEWLAARLAEVRNTP